VKRSEIVLAKVVLLVGASLMGTSWYFRGQPGVADEVPFLAIFAGALLVAAGAAGLYEGAALALAWVFSRVRRLLGGTPGADAVDLVDGTPVEGDEPSRRYGAKEAGFTFVAYVAGTVVVWLLVGLWVVLTAPPTATANEFEQAFLQVAPRWFVWAAVLGAGAALWTFHRLSPVPARTLPGVVGLGSTRAVALGVLVGMLANLTYLQLVPHLPVQPTRIPDSALWDLLLAPGASRWLVLLTAVTVAPVTEELVFRGLIFEGLRRSWSAGAAVVGSAALFTLLHVPDTAHFWPATVMIFLMGTLAGIARARTGRTGPAVGVHFGYNAVVAVIWLI
jgi:membrane protease YdiL (CAAX protease family)